MLATTEQPICSPPVINLPPPPIETLPTVSSLESLMGSWPKKGAAVGRSTQAVFRSKNDSKAQQLSRGGDHRPHPTALIRSFHAQTPHRLLVEFLE